MRSCGFAAVCAACVSAGTIASMSGSATPTPSPRTNVRRGIDRLVTNIEAFLTRAAHLERRAGHDAPNDRREAIAVARRAANDGTDGRHIVRLDAAAEGICHQLLDRRAHD